jgi:acyl-coenzyme A thioesterase PaaI-like protein
MSATPPQTPAGDAPDGATSPEGAESPEGAPVPEGPAGGAASPEGAADASDGASGSAGAGQPPREGPRALDGITSFIGFRWEDPQTVRLRIRPELINRGGLLSGVVTYAMVDYCMGSTLWAHTTPDERIATISISINYIQTAVEGEIVCRTVLDRRNRRIGILRSEISHEDGRLLVTAIGSYSIFPRKQAPSQASTSQGERDGPG